MKKSFFVFCIIIFSSCNSHPQAGDYYEDKSDGRRVRVVSVGSASEILKSFNRQKAMMEKINTKDVQVVVYFIGDSTFIEDATCVLFERQNQNLFKKMFSASEVEYFEKDYRIIN